MAESYPNWMTSLNRMSSNGDDDSDQSNENLMPNRPFGPRLSFFQNELHNLSQLSRQCPVNSNSPLTDDEKREIARRNNGFVTHPIDNDNQQGTI